MMNGKYSWLLSGVNVFDNIRWFNKESSDEALNILTSALLLGNSTAKEESVLAMYKALSTAKTKAAYKADNFVKPFEPAPKVEKKVTKAKSKKTAAAKKTAKKTAAKKVEKKPAAAKKAPAQKQQVKKQKSNL